MADNFGLSFSPLQQNQPGQYGSGSPPGEVSPIQQAIQILSLRRPRTYGASAPIPGALLDSAGSGGVPNLAATLRTLMQHLQGGFGLTNDAPGSVSPTSRSASNGFASAGSNPFAGIFGPDASPAASVALTSAPTPRFTPQIDSPGGSGGVYTPPDPPPYLPPIDEASGSPMTRGNQPGIREPRDIRGGRFY